MPRGLKTDVQPGIEDLPDLTPQQCKFVGGVLSGKTAADAYRSAYDCSGSGENTVWVEASRLRNHTSIALWLSEARKACLGAATVTLEGHLRELERIKEIALQSGNIGAAVQAEQCRGKAAGHYVEQIRDITDHDPSRTLTEIATHNPDLAASLAKAHNIPWEQDEATTRH